MFIFENNEGKLLLRDEFVLSCEFVKNLFEDTGETDPATPILFSNNYSLSYLKNMEQFFMELQSIHINDQPCLDFIAENRALYREKYAELINGKKIIETYTKYQKSIEKIPEYNTFLNNDKLILGVNVCLYEILNNHNEREEVLKYVTSIMME
jgi:hypothetical protein